MPARLFDFGYAPALHHIDRLPIVELGELDVDARLTGPAQVGSDSLKRASRHLLVVGGAVLLQGVCDQGIRVPVP